MAQGFKVHYKYLINSQIFYTDSEEKKCLKKAVLGIMPVSTKGRQKHSEQHHPTDISRLHERSHSHFVLDAISHFLCLLVYFTLI